MIIFSGIAAFSESLAQQIQYGIRTGINNNHKSNLDLSVYEIYIHGVPPIYLIADDDIFNPLDMSLEMTFSVMNDKTNNSLSFSLGPTIELFHYESIVFISAGIKPSLMTNYVFDEFNLGGRFNFKSHIELTASLIKNMNIGFGFEHISNAGLYKKNPGINLHYIEIAYTL